MTIGGIISAIIVGLIIGALARLILPGKQNINILLTILIGLVAAFIGGFIGHAIVDTDGFSWITLIIQIVLAVIGVAIVGGSSGRRSTSRR